MPRIAARIGTAPATAPDIYLVLLDGYPGTKARALDPSYPASDLGPRLRERGLRHGAGDALELPADHNDRDIALPDAPLVGLPELAAPWGPEPNDVQRLRMLLNDAPGLAVLRGLGYRSVAMASGFAEVELRRVDRLDEPPQPNEFEVSLIRGTGLGRILQATAPDLLPALQRDRITSSFADLRAIAAEPHDGPQVRLRASPGAAPAVGLRAGRANRDGRASTPSTTTRRANGRSTGSRPSARPSTSRRTRTTW